MSHGGDHTVCSSARTDAVFLMNSPTDRQSQLGYRIVLFGTARWRPHWSGPREAPTLDGMTLSCYGGHEGFCVRQ